MPSPESSTDDDFGYPDLLISPGVRGHRVPRLPQHLAIERRLIPAELNCEQKDFIKAASRDSFRYTRRPRDPFHEAFLADLEDGSGGDSGNLGKLPTELMSYIIEMLDPASSLSFRRANRSARRLVAGALRYREVIKYAFEFFILLVRQDFGRWYSLREIHCLLLEECCHYCDSFAILVSLPVWKKTCIRCRRKPSMHRQVISRGRARSTLKISIRRLKKLVPWIEAGYLEDQNRPLVTRGSVKKLFKAIPLSRPIQELNRQLKVAPKYLPRTEEVPFINKAANWLDDGMVCRGSRPRFAFLLTPPGELRHAWHIYSATELHVHASFCPYAQRLKFILEIASDTQETDEGWVLLNGPGDGGHEDLRPCAVLPHTKTI